MNSKRTGLKISHLGKTTISGRSASFGMSGSRFHPAFVPCLSHSVKCNICLDESLEPWQGQRVKLTCDLHEHRDVECRPCRASGLLTFTGQISPGPAPFSNPTVPSARRVGTSTEPFLDRRQAPWSRRAGEHTISAGRQPRGPRRCLEGYGYADGLSSGRAG